MEEAASTSVPQLRPREPDAVGWVGDGLVAAVAGGRAFVWDVASDRVVAVVEIDPQATRGGRVHTSAGALWGTERFLAATLRWEHVPMLEPNDLVHPSASLDRFVIHRGPAPDDVMVATADAELARVADGTRGATLSADGKRLLTCGVSGVALRAMPSDRVIASIPEPVERCSWSGAGPIAARDALGITFRDATTLAALAHRVDRARLASVSLDGERAALLVNGPTGHEIRVVRLPSLVVLARREVGETLRLALHGDLVAWEEEDGTASAFSLHDGRDVALGRLGIDAVSPSGHVLFVEHGDVTVTHRDWHRRWLSPFAAPLHVERSHLVAETSDGGRFVLSAETLTPSRAGEPRLDELEDLPVPVALPPDLVECRARRRCRLRSDASSDGRWIAAADSRRLMLFDGASGALLRMREAHGTEQLVFHDEGVLLQVAASGMRRVLTLPMLDLSAEWRGPNSGDRVLRPLEGGLLDIERDRLVVRDLDGRLIREQPHDHRWVTVTPSWIVTSGPPMCAQSFDLSESALIPGTRMSREARDAPRELLTCDDGHVVRTTMVGPIESRVLPLRCSEAAWPLRDTAWPLHEGWWVVVGDRPILLAPDDAWAELLVAERDGEPAVSLLAEGELYGDGVEVLARQPEMTRRMVAERPVVAWLDAHVSP